MGFRVRGSDSILQKLTNWISTSTDKITDFNPGSAIRTLLESISLQIEEFYYDLKYAVQFAIKNSGYHAFGFTKTNAKKSTGNVTIYFTDALSKPIIIKKGTEFHTGRTRLQKIYFKATESIKIEENAQAAIVPVQCDLYGEIGNVQAGEITKMTIGMANVHHIANLEDFTNGKDEESEIDREIRFKEYVHTLQRGTADAVAYGIKTVDGVSGVWVDDSNIGYMIAYVHDKNGNLSEGLKKQIDKTVYGYRSGGIEVEIRPIVKKLVDISIDVNYRFNINEESYDYLIEKLIKDYINSLKASEDLYMSNVVTVINDKYRDILENIEVCGNEDVMASNNELLRAGEIKVNKDGVK